MVGAARRGQGSTGLGANSVSSPLLPRVNVGKEEVLCRLQEENQRLSREQERVRRVDRQGDRLGASRVRAELQGPSCWTHCSMWVSTEFRMVGDLWGDQQGVGNWKTSRATRATGD